MRTLILFIALAGSALAQCPTCPRPGTTTYPPAICAPAFPPPGQWRPLPVGPRVEAPTPLVAAPAAPAGPRTLSLAWAVREDDPDRVYLYLDGHQVGGIDLVKQTWRTYNAATEEWGPVRRLRCPAGLADASCETEEPATTDDPVGPPAPPANFGLDLDRLKESCRPGERCYWKDGQRVSREQAFEAVAGHGLPDDADLLRVTLIGAKEDCDRVRADLDGAAELATWKGKLVVQDYRSSAEPILKGLGFESWTGSPAVVIQSPDRRVLAAGPYSGAAPLASAIEAAARKRDPLFDPSKVPALTPPSLVPTLPKLSDLSWGHWAALAVAGYVALSLLRNRNKVNP